MPDIATRSLIYIVLLPSILACFGSSYSEDIESDQSHHIQTLIANGKDKQLLEFLIANPIPQYSFEASKWALSYRQPALAERINSEIEVSLTLKNYANLLELSVTYDAPGMIRALMKEHKDLLNYEWTIPLLRLAAENGSFHSATVLLNANYREELYQALISAILTGHVDLVWLLIDKIDLTDHSIEEQARLMESAIYAGQLTVIQQLIERGISVNNMSPSGPHVAMAVGRPESHKRVNSQWTQQHIYQVLIASGLDECRMLNSFNDENKQQIGQYSPNWFKEKIAELEKTCNL